MKKIVFLLFMFAIIPVSVFSTEAIAGEGSVEISLNLFSLTEDAISLGFTDDEVVDWNTKSDVSSISLIPGTDGIARLGESFKIFALILSDSEGTVRVESDALEAYLDEQPAMRLADADLGWDMTIKDWPKDYSFGDSNEEGDYVLFTHYGNENVAAVYVAEVESIMTKNYIEKLEETGARSWKQTFTLVWDTK